MGISQAALNRGRRAAESDMRSTCRITRAGSGQVWNKVTLQYDPAPRILVYEGRCKLRRLSGLQERDTEAAGQRYIEQPSTLHLPVRESGRVRRDDDVEMLSSQTDDELIDKRYRVVKSVSTDNATSRRFTVQETQ